MSQALGPQYVDPFSVENPSDLADWQIPLTFMKSRHSSVAESKDIKANSDSWRMKDRVLILLLSGVRILVCSPLLQMKTWSVALVLCLNIGVDPPDVVKTNPCARKESWIGL